MNESFGSIKLLRPASVPPSEEPEPASTSDRKQTGTRIRITRLVTRAFPALLVLFTAACIQPCTASPNAKTPEEQALASLELRAEQAPPSSQCYAYAQLVHEMVEYGARQYAEGNAEKASELLKGSEEFTRRIRIRLTNDTKKLKQTEILLRRTAFRLTDLLHSGNTDDGGLIQETLAQLGATRNDLMMRLFMK